MTCTDDTDKEGGAREPLFVSDGEEDDRRNDHKWENVVPGKRELAKVRETCD